MAGICAKRVPWTITNTTRVDDKHEFSFEGHSGVKGQIGALNTKNNSKIRYILGISYKMTSV